MTTTQPAAAAVLDEDTAYAIGIEAYVYLYPLVLMELTRRQATNVETAGARVGRGPADSFVHVREFPPAGFRDVVKPNFDTLYSAAWLDLRDEPRIISAPASDDHYYLLPLYDMWGEVFACPGTRTTGTTPVDFAVVGPRWSGELPDGVRRYDAPTSTVWVVGRTRASVATYDEIRAFQDDLQIAPLSAWGGEVRPVRGTVDPEVDDETPPLEQVFALDAAGFFGLAADLLSVHAPHFQDYPVLDRLSRAGLRPEAPFDLSRADPAVRQGFEKAVPEAQAQIRGQQTKLGRQVNGWGVMSSNIGNYGTDYLTRACVELIGLGANLAADAIYPVCYVDADGSPLDGAHSYVWRLEADELPPVRAFWSLTLYDDDGFQVANQLNRFAIGDRDPLEFGDDGSLDIYIQADEPASGRSNWLPAPRSSFNLCARLYYPKAEALDGRWSPPPVTRM